MEAGLGCFSWSDVLGLGPKLGEVLVPKSLETSLYTHYSLRSKQDHSEMVQQSTIDNDYSSSSSLQLQCFTNNEAR